jgi:cytochrome c-type biogenesis protein
MNEILFTSTVFTAGILSFLSPCIIPIIPLYLGYFADEDLGQTTQAFLKPSLIKAILFVMGLSTVFILLGFGAGVLGSILYGDWFLVACGLVVIVLGIHQTGLIQINLLQKEQKIQVKRTRKLDYIGAYVLGLTFSFGWTPCIGPVLAAVLGLTLSGGNVVYGGFLMAVYSLGLMIPFLIVAIFSDQLLSRMKNIYKYMGKIKIIGGLMVIFMGVLLMTNQIASITAWFVFTFS